MYEKRFSENFHCLIMSDESMYISFQIRKERYRGHICVKKTFIKTLDYLANLSTMSTRDEGYSRNASHALI